MSIKRKPLGKRFWITSVLVGVIIICASSFYFFINCKKHAEDDLVKIVHYMKAQCAAYTHYNNGAETQALLRAVESNKQVRNNISALSRAGGELNEEFLKNNLDELWLYGIIVYDAEGEPVISCAKDKQIERLFLDNYSMSGILDGVGYPTRNYTQRITLDDGSYINMAATARTDAEGMVATYYYITPESARSYSLTLQSLLEGYKVSTDGTVMIADEGHIIACNNTELIGQRTTENSIVQQIKKAGDSKHIIHIAENHSYGVMLKQRDYYIYAYCQDKNVFSSLPMDVLICMLMYMMIVSVSAMLIRRTDSEHIRLEMEKEEEYKKELFEAAKKADAANIAKTEFLQRMSHDIRTPINGICGMIEVADYYADDLDKQTECRTKIKEASNLLLELINEVLDMGKLESGEIKLDSRPFNLHDTIDEVITVIDKLALEQGITLKQEEYKVVHWNLIGSPLHVKRLLMNIMSNAVKYNKENGSITIKMRELAGTDADSAVIEFVCEDTGIGMSEDYQQRIFEPFTQEEKGSRPKYAGTGLGMPIAKGLAEKMNGTITFESEEGKGTTFVVTIPFRIDETHREIYHKLIPEGKSSIEGWHILLVEDNELNMEIAEFGLEREGAVIQKAWDGMEAFELFEGSKPGEYDAILTDVMMPVMDGYQLAGRIRALDRLDAKTIPIIAMTANAFTEDRIKSREAGMDAHISKPINSKLVIETLYRLVDARRDADMSKEI